jgi:hypothetical protein
MKLRSPLNVGYTIGLLGWPVGGFGFDGFDTATGGAIIGTGSLLVLACFGAELGLRLRDRRRASNLPHRVDT